jgi:[acyl-carrier-protein] S-malonyltransferase/trans-AT polyketide synthase/acyltransferase/oxidoreductase domain-containing protein
MGRDFDTAFAAARATFDEVSDALDLDVRWLCFSPNDPRLQLTEFAQPAILACEIAMLRALVAERGLAPTHFAGHSLGEYTALVAAGVIGLGEAVRLVRERGRRMQAIVAPGIGAMLAFNSRKLDRDTLDLALQGLSVDIASDNGPGQLVISGTAEDVAEAARRLGPGFKSHALAVSAPFHSRLMTSMEPNFGALLAEAVKVWRVGRATVVASNYTGGFHSGDPSDLVKALTRQISGRVRWSDNVRALAKLTPGLCVEIGPSSALRALCGLQGLVTKAVTSAAEAQAWGE